MKGNFILKCGQPTTKKDALLCCLKNTPLTDVSGMCLADSPFCLAINYSPSNGKFLKSQKMGIKQINGFMKAVVEKISEANGEKLSTLTTATGKHSLIHCLATTLNDQILVNLAVIAAMSKVLTAMPQRPTKHNGECRPSKASGCVPRLSKVKILTDFKSQRQLQIQAMPSVRIPQLGVSNGLCEHLRACEQCVYFCEHEQ